MGFDNECILNIQSLPGEYFCPVCRTLVFPNEALQSQCTHLYCKPCLSYIVATTHACPYDGYLVTEADSKPLVELNKALAETVGKVQVYCLFHRSGCQWQGALSDCVNHCTGCNFGNSPVVCNRCGTQIVHRQVQEHAQTCPGLQPQGQQIENTQAHALPASNQDAAVDSSATAMVSTMPSLTSAMMTTIPTSTTASSAPMPANVHTAASAAGAIAQAQNQVIAIAYPQAGMPAPMTEQWYRQQHLQYQQYYQQQYPGYDPYQQYSQYQQQTIQQYPQALPHVASQQAIQGQQQVQPYVQQPQSNAQPHQQPHALPQAQLQTHGTQLQAQQQPAIQAQLQSQPHLQLPGPPQPMPQPQTQPLQYTHPQSQLQAQHLSHSQFPQTQNISVQQPHQQIQPQITPPAIQSSVHPVQQPNHPQSQPPYPQPQQPMLHSQPSQSVLQPQLPPPSSQQQQLHSQSQSRSVSLPQAQPYSHVQPQFQQPHMQQPRPLLQTQPQPQLQTQNSSAQGVTGHQSYLQAQPLQQAPQHVSQRPMNPQQSLLPQQGAQTQFPIHQSQQVRPPQTHLSVQAQQYPAMQLHAHQAPFPNAASHQAAQHFLHQQPGQQIPHPVGGMQMQPQQQALPQHQASGPFPSSLPQQSGFASQPLSHSSQVSLRPQIQSYNQSQLNASSVQGRTSTLNQPLPQPANHSPGKPIQSGMNQHSPSHSNLATQHGSIHQLQQHIGNQGSIGPSTSHSESHAKNLILTGSDGKSAVLDKSADSMPDRATQLRQLDVMGVTSVIADGSEKSRSLDLVISNPDSLCNTLKEGEKSIEAKEYSEIKENKDLFQDGDGSTSQASEGPKESNIIEAKQNAKPTQKIEYTLDENNKLGENADQGSDARNQTSANAIQTMPVGKLHHGVESLERGSGFYDKGVSQFPPPQAGVVGLRGISSSDPPPGHERYLTQNVPVGQLANLDASVVPQRPSGPDGLFSQAASNHERKIQDSFLPPNSLHGPPPPGQLRPPGYSENFPYPVQTQAIAETFPYPAGKQLFRNSKEINPFSVRSNSLGQPFNAVDTAVGQIDLLALPGLGGPPPRAFDATSGVMNRGSHSGYEDHGGRPPVNLMEGPGYYDVKQPDFHRSMPAENVPFVHQTNLPPNTMKMNGLSAKGPAGITHDSPFCDSMQDDRLRPPPGDRLKPWLEESFRSESIKPMMNSGRNIANHREYEEDMKQFPRPSNFDGDGTHMFNAYGLGGRPMERVHHFGPDFGSKPFDRVFPPPPPQSSRFPPGSGGLEFGSVDIPDRQKGPSFYDETHPDRLRFFSDFGRSRFDSLPPIRSPGHFRKEIDAFDVSNDRMRSFENASHGLARFGGYGQLPTGDPGFSNSYSSHDPALETLKDGFEHSRKRKPASTGWCRLCKVDCETIEALEVHAQTKDHQNTAMEIVLNIKKENAKKQTLISDESMDANKSRKTSFENRRR